MHVDGQPDAAVGQMLDRGDAAGEPRRDLAAEHLGAGAPGLDLGERARRARRAAQRTSARCEAGRARARTATTPQHQRRRQRAAESRLAAEREIDERADRQEAPARGGRRCRGRVRSTAASGDAARAIGARDAARRVSRRRGSSRRDRGRRDRRPAAAAERHAGADGVGSATRRRPAGVGEQRALADANIVRSPSPSGDRSCAIPSRLACPLHARRPMLHERRPIRHRRARAPHRSRSPAAFRESPCPRPSSPALPPRPPATCTSAARARRCSTGSMPATPAARCCCASRTPTASARPRPRPRRSSTG